MGTMDNPSLTSSFEDVSAEMSQRHRDTSAQESDPSLVGGLSGGLGKVVADQVVT